MSNEPRISASLTADEWAVVVLLVKAAANRRARSDTIDGHLIKSKLDDIAGFLDRQIKSKTAE